MIIDTQLFNSTSRGSGRKISCRCDSCGAMRMLAKQKLVQRGDDFSMCRECYYKRNETQTKSYVMTKCSGCGLEKARRMDSLGTWGGKCKSCASKELAARPGMKAIHRENGRRNPPDRAKVKNLLRGPSHPRWKGGITPETQRIRLSAEMKEWRRRVFERDDYTCQVCSKRGGTMNADHIQPFSLFPDLRFDVSNGRTLCMSCHRCHGALVCNGRITRQASFG